MLPIPCAHNDPSQHDLEYVFFSLQKHARVPPPCGELRDGVFHPCDGAVVLL